MPHHGGADVASPALFAVQPRVAIMNNGATKGGSPEAFEALHQAIASRGLQDVWQVDKSANAGVRNFADERIANLERALRDADAVVYEYDELLRELTQLTALLLTAERA